MLDKRHFRRNLNQMFGNIHIIYKIQMFDFLQNIHHSKVLKDACLPLCRGVCKCVSYVYMPTEGDVHKTKWSSYSRVDIDQKINGVAIEY